MKYELNTYQNIDHKEYVVKAKVTLSAAGPKQVQKRPKGLMSPFWTRFSVPKLTSPGPVLFPVWS